MKHAFIAIGLCALTACGITDPLSYDEAQDRCTARAKSASGPTGKVTVGVNSETGLTTGASIAVSSDFLAGTDPQDVFFSCMQRLTGEPPVRALQL